MAPFLFPFALSILPFLTVAAHNTSTGGCAIIRPPRDGGIRYRGLTQEQDTVIVRDVDVNTPQGGFRPEELHRIRSIQILPVDYEIEYICRGNRVIVGPKVRKCLPNGSWTELTQRSRCLLMCPRVWTSLENGQVTMWPTGLPVEGTVLQYSCLAGFRLVGRNSTLCSKLGKWDSPKPVCHYDRHYSGRCLEAGLPSRSGETPAACQ